MLLFALVALLLGSAYAHMAPWTDSMFGATKTAQMPLAAVSWSSYWFHGPDYIADPPASGAFTNLVAGKSVTLPIACQRNLVPGTPGGGLVPPTTDSNGFVMDACNALGPYHTSGTIFDPTQMTGCALGIADATDPTTLDPKTFTIFSVQHQCVYRQNTTFDIPAALPSCTSPDGCLCAWFWTPRYSASETYMVGFRCKVQPGPKTCKIGTGKAAVPCGDDPSKCTSGPKQPNYWCTTDGPTNQPSAPQCGINAFNATGKPEYTAKWGFQDGAQNDMFAAGCNVAAAPPTTSGSPVPLIPLDQQRPDTTIISSLQPACTPPSGPRAAFMRLRNEA